MEAKMEISIELKRSFHSAIGEQRAESLRTKPVC